MTLRPEILHADIVKQRRAPLCCKRVIALQKDRQTLAGGTDRHLRMYPSIFRCLVPGKPLHGCCLPVFPAREIHAQRKLYRRLAAHVFAPGLDLVAVTGDGLSLLEYARLGADKVEGDLLGAPAAMHVVQVPIFVDTVYNRISP